MRILIYISVIFLPTFVVAQLITSTGQSPTSLVQNVLLGPGVTVSNINYNGSPAAIGYFNGAGTNIGITEGIVMTTGTVLNNGSGPHGPNNAAGSGIDNNVGGSGLLSNLIGGATTLNAAILEFDFVPYSDTVRFRYVFGSEEYPEYAPPNNSGFNDVFGFFISGPGITGNTNIAQLPAGAGVVSINNVNAITNSAYFTDNGNGNSPPQNGSPVYIQYDGFTKVLEAVSRVQCGKTYHLILAVADVTDGIYDSGIFLQANSLSSKTPVDITYTLSQQTTADPSMMSEGCVTATVQLERGQNGINLPLTIPISVSGTATEGVDYSNIPPSITFAANQSIVTFPIDAFSDGLAEGIETITLEFLLTDPCGNQTPIVVNLKIQDVEPVAVSISEPIVECPGDLVQLTATPSGGAPPYSYLWSTGETTQTIAVSPNSTQTFSVSVTDDCLGETATANTTVSVPVFTPLTLTTSGNITEICPYIVQLMNAVPAGGAGDYTFQWSILGGANLGTAASQSVAPSSSTIYVVTVTDKCGNTATAQIVYSILSPPLLLTMTPTVEVCPGDSVLIGVSATGGFGQYYYSWPSLGASTSQVWVNPLTTTNYTVIVSDECQTFTVSGSTTITVVKPTANFFISSHTLFDDLPITFQNASINAATYFWTFGDGNNSALVHPNNTYEEPGLYYVTLVATDEKGCIDSITKPINIKEAYYVYVPNTFTPDGLRSNNYFSASFYGIRSASVMIFNRWGEKIFVSDEMDFEWDGTYNNVMVQNGTYSWKITYITNFGLEETITGHVNLIR
ncbi:MAG: choice-of-anchor L domain-containing protein [Crocinitomicaceae bacterium]|nr:choice-of-anchor L domain-containing protein [Crocinitomicaceae bacterium]MCF8433588.1 choice-of-anchor L domain-containing protein [Crocinitomicaceae bacterium]